jgi:CRISPR/Cas system CSM-associated protein Csm3 (group 7 of RAMP superfamily)
MKKKCEYKECNSTDTKEYERLFCKKKKKIRMCEEHYKIYKKVFERLVILNKEFSERLKERYYKL